jgi:hypothetical protein
VDVAVCACCHGMLGAMQHAWCSAGAGDPQQQDPTCVILEKLLVMLAIRTLSSRTFITNCTAYTHAQAHTQGQCWTRSSRCGCYNDMFTLYGLTNRCSYVCWY